MNLKKILEKEFKSVEDLKNIKNLKSFNQEGNLISKNNIKYSFKTCKKNNNELKINIKELKEMPTDYLILMDEKNSNLFLLSANKLKIFIDENIDSLKKDGNVVISNKDLKVNNLIEKQIKNKSIKLKR